MIFKEACQLAWKYLSSRTGLILPLILLLTDKPAFVNSGPAIAAPLAQGVVFTVNSAADPGSDACNATECTLREAISAANATVVRDTIEFNIPGGGAHTIRPVSPLPTITNPVIIDGYTQPGASPNTLPDGNDAVLLIELDGSAGLPLNGLEIVAGDSLVRGLAINRFGQTGVVLRNRGNNIIEGNFIGPDLTGTQKQGNGQDGIAIIDSSNNRIGGQTADARNLISGNDEAGIVIANSGSISNTVEGNFIGTHISGILPLGNSRHGVLITATEGRDDHASGNTIGGTAQGARNIISGNGQFGIEIFRGELNRVYGNFIGTDVTGFHPLPNVENGVIIHEGSDNFIGGTVAGAGNLISGNGLAGIQIFAINQEAAGNLIQGNIIGMDKLGLNPLSNMEDGILLQTKAGGGFGVSNTTIGGSDEDDGSADGVVKARNYISGNAQGGVAIVGDRTISNQVVGNFIGPDITGAAAPDDNQGYGVLITSSKTGGGGASANTIGGTQAGAGNVISGNDGDGIQLGFGATDNRIMSNLIGPTALGDEALGNGRHGVAIFDSPGNIIGGTEGGALNVISGNGVNGVFIGRGGNGGGAVNNQVLGNYIGLKVNGSEALGNGHHGVLIEDTSDNIIGGTAVGSGNVISGNNGNGVYISGDAARNNQVLGNRIGSDDFGSSAVPNTLDGVFIFDAPENIIGGPLAGEQNLISGNDENGIQIFGVGATSNRVQNNLIGPALDGLTDLGNGGHGVLIVDGSNNLIGDTDLTRPASNVIAFNGRNLQQRGHGVVIASGTGNSIRRNLIFENEGRGIDLGNNFWFLTLNDAREIDGDVVFDDDTGANNLQNYPVVTRVQFDSPVWAIEWTLSSTPDTTFIIDFFANSGADGSGFGEGERLLRTRTITTDENGRATIKEIFDLTDKFIAVTTTDEFGNTSEFSMVDTDGDALADAWESLYIDINEDGEPDFILLEADPAHKDLFVEVDAMLGFTPHPNALNAVEAAFATAPQALVQNPDGEDGISLHIDLDETNIPHHPWIGDADGDGEDEADGWPFFDRIKQGELSGGGFGTLAERNADNSSLLLEAKRLVYRYAIFADRYDAKGTSGESESLIKETWLEGGNDFFITLGLSNPSGGTVDEQAGTFMHELGHTLGLGHGGGDNVRAGLVPGSSFVNYKPNYHSIMNYTWQFPKPGYGPWTLDYSRTEFQPLDESDLDESAGLGGDQGITVPIGPKFVLLGVPVITKTIAVTEGGPIDLNFNKTSNDINVVRDLNFLFDNDEDGDIDGDDATPGQTLYGHEDWSRLRYSFLGTPDFADGTHAKAPYPEMTLEVSEFLDSIGDGPGSLQFSHALYEVDETATEVTIRVTRAAGTDGPVTVDYVVSDGTATAGSDYTPISGTLSFDDIEYQKTFTIPILDDALAEGTETVILTLTNPGGGASLGTPSIAELHILDDDAVTFTVTHTGDSGPGSLRQAILDANANPGLNVIDFAIPEPGVRTIQPLSPLPTITDPVVIDGYTQPGARPNRSFEINDADLRIQLDNSNPGSSSGLVLAAENSTIRGLVITRFKAHGIELRGNGNRVHGNYIGISANQSSILGNGFSGVLASGSGNQIGGTWPGVANLIAFNHEFGVQIVGVDNRVRGNALFSNDLLGISLGSSLPALNDLGDGDTGPNQGQNYPVLAAATAGTDSTTFVGRLDSTPNTSFSLDFYRNHQLDASGHGEGFIYLGAAKVTTTADGHTDFVITLPVVVPNGSLISATATDPDGNTSEFSARLVVGDVLAPPFVVNSRSEGDNGVCNASHCTLREAIHAANNHPGMDRIEFAIPSTGVQTISPLQVLPVVADPTIIDGYTQPGSSPNTLTDGNNAVVRIELSGRTARIRTQNYLFFGLRIIAGNSVVRGLAVNDVNNAIWLSHTGGNRLEGNFIGTTTTGAGGVGNFIGVLVAATSENVIGGTASEQRNLISGNLTDGILISAALNNRIQGNYIGTDRHGLSALANGSTGINHFSGSGNIIGGTVPGAGNLISGNGSSGLLGIGIRANGEGLQIQGNNIGTSRDGTASLGNKDWGILLSGSGHIVGGVETGVGNLISGNGRSGISLSGENHLVQGNLIGTDSTGHLDLGNNHEGVVIGGNDNTIGGVAAGAGNLISGNNRSGVFISGSNNHIQNNRIGTQIDGTGSLGNEANGILVVTGASNNIIGGTDSGAGNTIAFNGGDGVSLESSTETGNAVLVNSIASNTGLGIDLFPDGVTPNDAGDGDNGANNLQNFPVLTAISSSAGSTTLTGTLNSAVNTAFRLEFFVNETCDASNFGEGETFLGSATVTTDAGGDAPFVAVLPAAVFTHQFVTATATDPDNNTSEFSACKQVDTSDSVADLALSKTSSPDPVLAGELLTYTLIVSNAGPNEATGVTISDTLPAGVTFNSVESGAATCIEAGGLVTCDFGNLTGNAGLAIIIDANVDPALVTGTIVTNLAEVTANTYDNQLSNNTAIEETEVHETSTAIELLSFTARAGGDGVTLAWETATEIDNAGFNLYRAASADGPYAKINAILIPAEGNAFSGASYTYLDKGTNEENIVYFYELEDVDRYGISTFHGPVSTSSDTGGKPPSFSQLYLPIVIKLR